MSLLGPSSINTPGSDTRNKVLIVEDDPGIRNLCIKVFTKANFWVNTASDSREAIQKIAADMPHLIILDLNLEASSGLDVLAYLEKHDHLRHNKVIVISADDAALSHPLIQLADLSFIKPVSVLQLGELAKRLIVR